MHLEQKVDTLTRVQQRHTYFIFMTKRRNNSDDITYLILFVLSQEDKPLSATQVRDRINALKLIDSLSRPGLAHKIAKLSKSGEVNRIEKTDTGSAINPKHFFSISSAGRSLLDSRKQMMEKLVALDETE